jgi:hypothetical protein
MAKAYPLALIWPPALPVSIFAALIRPQTASSACAVAAMTAESMR